MQSNGILPSKVRTDFPVTESFDDTDLGRDSALFLDFAKTKDANLGYIMYSNVLNNDEIAAAVKGKQLIYETIHGQVFCRLYSTPPPIKNIQAGLKL